MLRNNLILTSGALFVALTAHAGEPSKAVIKYPPAKTPTAGVALTHMPALSEAADEKKLSGLPPDFTRNRSNEFETLNSTILPEVSTQVIMSSMDLNRLTCNDEIKDVLTSQEKGAVVKIVGKNAFIKFKVLKTAEGKVKYSSTPTEFFVVCGDDTYSLVANPQPVRSQIVRLGSGIAGKIKENHEIYGSLPFEKKITRAIKDLYTENIPDSYVVQKVSRSVGNYQEFSVIHRRSVNIEGEGLSINEFDITLKPGAKQFKLNEKIFLSRLFATNPVAVSLEKQMLTPGENVRLFIVEQRRENQATMRLSNPLQLEDGDVPQPSSPQPTLAKTKETRSQLSQNSPELKGK